MSTKPPLAGGVYHAAAANQADSDNGDILNKSLSSAFFRGVKSNPTAALPTSSKKNTGDDLLPPPPVISIERGLNGGGGDSSKVYSEIVGSSKDYDSLLQEKKLRESATTMAQMKERLRAIDSSAQRSMDLSSSSSKQSTNLSSSPTKVPPPVASNQSNDMVFLRPPTPPPMEARGSRKGSNTAEVQQPAANDDIEIGVGDEDIYDTPSTVSEDELGSSVAVNQKNNKKNLFIQVQDNQAAIATASIPSVQELKSKTNEFKSILK